MDEKERSVSSQPSPSVNNDEVTQQELRSVQPLSAQITPSTSKTTDRSQLQSLSVRVSKRPRSKWFLPAILAGFILLGGGAAAYISVFQKSPENLWKNALSNTARGFETYLDNSLAVEQNGIEMEGDFKISSPIAVDGSMQGAWLGATGSLAANLGAAGARFTAELLTIPLNDQTTPDVYMKVSGLEGLDTFLESFGVSDLSNLDTSAINDQWFFIDHTLIDQYLSTQETDPSLELTQEDVKQITEKLVIVMRERMFTTVPDKAVLEVKEQIGKEEFDGMPTYRYRVGINQANFAAFVNALKDAIKDTQLETLLLSGQSTDSIEEVLDFDNVIREIEEADFSNAEADVWVEANGRFVRNVRIYPVEGKENSNYLDIGLDITGGETIPLEIKATVDDEGAKGTIALVYTIFYKNADLASELIVDMMSDGAPIRANAKLSIKNTNDAVSVETPTDVKNIFELFSAVQSSLPADDTSLYDDEGTSTDDFLGEFDFNSLPTDDVEL